MFGQGIHLSAHLCHRRAFSLQISQQVNSTLVDKLIKTALQIPLVAFKSSDLSVGLQSAGRRQEHCALSSVDASDLDQTFFEELLEAIKFRRICGCARLIRLLLLLQIAHSFCRLGCGQLNRSALLLLIRIDSFK
ncbi:MAG: hypothetical protein E5Y76_03450, partial [Mesorhizobium sp.]